MSDIIKSRLKITIGGLFGSGAFWYDYSTFSASWLYKIATFSISICSVLCVFGLIYTFIRKKH